jgi:tripartite-type tricarboxylate transporter receptor subunit TctC
LATGAIALPAVSRIAWAQSYPTQPVRMIVGFAAGQAIDILARLVGQWLSERLAQPFVIENRPGAGGNIGTDAVVRAAPDGYTLLVIGANNAINATLYRKLNFNLIRDIVPVASQNIKSASDTTSAKWNGLKAKIAADIDNLKSKVAQKKHDLDVKRAANYAELLDEDASFAIDYAIASIEQAKVAVLDAIAGRLEVEKAKRTAA